MQTVHVKNLEKWMECVRARVKCIVYILKYYELLAMYINILFSFLNNENFIKLQTFDISIILYARYVI